MSWAAATPTAAGFACATALTEVLNELVDSHLDQVVTVNRRSAASTSRHTNRRFRPPGRRMLGIRPLRTASRRARSLKGTRAARPLKSSRGVPLLRESVAELGFDSVSTICRQLAASWSLKERGACVVGLEKVCS